MKKILIFSDYQMCYLSYMVHHGFCQLYGGENVITYPFKGSHHGKTDNQYILDDGKVGMTAPAQHMEVLEGREYTASEIVGLIKTNEIRIAIIHSARTYTIRAARQFIELLHKNKVPVIFIDGEDGLNIRKDIILEFEPLLSFKRELITQHQTDKILPLPFSCTIDPDTFPDNPKKDIDIFFGVGFTHQRRKSVIEKLNTIKDKYKIVSLIDGPGGQGKLSYIEYLDHLSRSKINIICRGHGYDTVRRFEAPAFSGLILSDALPIITPNNWTHSENIIYYKPDCEDLLYLIDRYLSPQFTTTRQAIGIFGRDHLFNYHTSKKSAEYIMKKVIDNSG